MLPQAVEELRTAAPPAGAPATGVDEAHWRDNFFRFLQGCGQHKERLGEQVYYQVIRRCGPEKANQIAKGDYATLKRVEQALREAGPHTADERFNREVAELVAAAVGLRVVERLDPVAAAYGVELANLSATTVPPDRRPEVLDPLRIVLDEAASEAEAAVDV
ncbi:MAG: hypothetical protein AB1505_17235 [Candidatus Latescibacterota bacterium]